jgi:hypothetical protein
LFLDEIIPPRDQPNGNIIDYVENGDQDIQDEIPREQPADLVDDSEDMNPLANRKLNK